MNFNEKCLLSECNKNQTAFMWANYTAISSADSLYWHWGRDEKREIPVKTADHWSCQSRAAPTRLTQKVLYNKDPLIMIKRINHFVTGTYCELN